MSLLGHSTLFLKGHGMTEVPNDWNIFSMDNEDDLVNYRLVCFTSALDKVKTAREKEHTRID